MYFWGVVGIFGTHTGTCWPTLQVLIAGVEIDEEVESLVLGHATDVAELEAWRGRVAACAPWWPSAGMDDDTRDRCWKAARLLLAADGKRPLR